MHDAHDSKGSDAATMRDGSHSTWRKGCLLGLFLAGGFVWMVTATATPACALDSFAAANVVSLHVGGFSLFVTWNTHGCR